MFKNMIRKSLALGSGLALAATGLVAAPAQATATGLLWSAYGQTNEMVGVEGHVFTLQFASPTGVVGTGADDTAELAGVANNVSVTMVENPNVATIAVTPVAKLVANLDTASGSGTITAQVGAVDLTGSHRASGVIEIAPPSSMTHTIQVDVQVTYDDGSKSEVERVTFVPKKSVSTAVSVKPVAISNSADRTGNTFSFSGINTGNFIQSNFTGGGASGAAVATKFGTAVTVGGTGATSKDWTYVQLTDEYTFTYTDAIVAGDAIVAKVNLWNGTASINANKYFLSTADDAEGKFTVSATGAYAAMDIVAATSAAVVQNTGTATSTVSAETVVAEEGTKTLNFVIQLFTDSAKTTAAGANNAVTVTLTDDANKLGTTKITAEGKSLDVTGSSISFTKVTNSSGQIAFTVTADKAVDGESFLIDATGSLASISIDQTTVKWQEAAWTLLPAVDGNFTIAPQGSLAVDYTVVNQFGALANADYQLVFTRAAAAGDRDTAAEYANWSYVAPVSATGRASVTIVDNGAASVEGNDTVTVALQKKATSGTGYISVAGSTDTFNLKYENDLASMKVEAKANYNGIANAAGTTIEPLKLETKTLVDYDSRLAGVKPSFATDGTYIDVDSSGTNNAGDTQLGNVPTSAAGVTPVTYGTNMLRIFGTVRTAANVGISGVAVKISGTGANFANASTIASATQMKNDSLVVFTDATGSYEAFVRSAVAGTQTITVDAQGVTTTVPVRFQDSTGVASAMTLSVPSSVASGARADIVAKVVDKFGKPVAGVTVNFKDNGPGVLNAATATTDIFGEAQVTLTTVAAESGTTTVTAFATIAGVTTVQTASITVGAAAASTDGKVNVGSFNGKLVVYALGLDGAKISWKVAGRWGVATASGNDLNRFDRPVGAAGVTVNVEIYVNGVKQLTKSVVTR